MTFSTALRSVLVFTFLRALAVSAAPGLTLKISGAEKVDGVNNLKVVVNVHNSGDESLKLLNDPRTTLSTMPTEKFMITHASGSAPDFIGVRAKYVSEVAALSGDKEAFTFLAPGQSVDVTHDLSEAYNFTRTGEGEYTFNVGNEFQHVDADNNIVPLVADMPSIHAASISGKLAVAKSFHSKRATFVGCSATQQSQINAATGNAQQYANAALSYLTSHTTSTPRFTTWFGTYDAQRRNVVGSHFQNIRSNNIAGFTYDCSTCTRPGVYAYVYPTQFGKIYLCPVFWQAPPTGTDSKAGTIVHETSHFDANGGTRDYAYGQSSCQSLARSNPSQAVMNADSHEYFAENTPALQ